MAEEQVLIPVGAPESPPYANAYVIRNEGEVVTLFLMRLPPAFTEEKRLELLNAKELHAPVVASVTLTVDGARTLGKLIHDFATNNTTK